MKALDLSGQKFNRLTPLSRVENAKNGQSMWLCRCDCRRETVQVGNQIKSGYVKSCGCLRVEQNRRRPTVHGLCGTSEYTSWLGMRDRCSRPNNQKWGDYGGRGIRVCERWQSHFLHFLADMGPKPSPAHSLDRIDVNGDYEPANCRWATVTEQNWNRRPRRRWAKKTPAKAINKRMQRSLRDCLVGRSKAGKRWQEWVGYSVDDLRVHIERQFERGMGWHNIRQWHLEHIVPKSAFAFETIDEDGFRQCWALTNLRPAWAFDNLSKKAKRLHLV